MDCLDNFGYGTLEGTLSENTGRLHCHGLWKKKSMNLIKLERECH